ncbi:unnamed protein product [Victoria cruziana]
MRAQRHKIVTWEIIDKTPLFSFDISRMMNLIFKNWIEEKSLKIKTYDYVGEGAKEKEKIEEEHEEEKGEYKRKEDKSQEEEQIAIAEAWDNIILAQVIRIKNIGYMLLFQFPKWYEDFNEWNREMHVKCSIIGTKISKGLKKLRSHHKDLRKKQKNFYFLMVWGMETELPFVKKKGFFFLIILKDNIKGFLKILNEKIRWIIIVLSIKIKVKELLFFFRVMQVSDPSQNEEPSQNEKNSKISNRIIHEIYMGILLCITNIYRINVHFFLDSIKKTLNGYTYNDEIKEKDTNEINPNIIPFISTIRSLSTYTTNISSDSNSPIYCDLSSLSQAYVFYKLFQTQVSNKYKPESIFNYCRTYPFIEDRIKDYFHVYFHTREIFDSESKHKKLQNSGMSEWKNWLKSHYQYNLSHDKWSINQHRTIKNNDSPKLGSYEEKYQLLHSGKKDYEKLGLLKSSSRKKKHYRYDLLSYKYFNHEDKQYETRTSMGIRTFINKKKKTTKLGPIKKIFFLFISEFIKKSKQSKKKFVLLYDRYKTNLWITPIKLLLYDFHGNKASDLYIDQKVESNKKERFNSKPKILRNAERKKLKSKKEAELDFFLKKYFLFQLRRGDSFNQRMTNNIKVYCLLLRLMNPNEIAIYSIQRGEMGLDVMLINKDLSIPELIKRGILLIESVRLSIKWDGISIMYQTIAISLTHKVQHQINRGYEVKKRIDKEYFNGSIARHGGVRVNGDNNNYDLFVPEHILSPSHRRELRIISHFNYRNRNLVNKNPVFYNRAKTNAQGFDNFVNKDKHFDTNTNNSLK